MPHSRYTEIMNSKHLSLGLSWSNWISVHFIALINRIKPLWLWHRTLPIPPWTQTARLYHCRSFQKGHCHSFLLSFKITLSISPSGYIFNLPFSVHFHDDHPSYKPSYYIKLPFLLALQNSAGNTALRFSWPLTHARLRQQKPTLLWCKTSVVIRTLLYCSVLFLCLPHSIVNF